MSTRTNLIEDQVACFSVLSAGQKRKIYSEVLEVLQYTGARIHHDQVLEKLAEKGCSVDGNRVYIPSQLVSQALLTVPPVTTIHSWDGKHRLRIELGRTHFGPGPTCPNFEDPMTGERRPYLFTDVSTVARVCDALPNIEFIMSLGWISDVSNGLEEAYEFAELIQNSSKPIIAWGFTKEKCEIIHKIAVAMAGGETAFRHRPNYIFYSEPISPLVCDHDAVEKLIYCAEHGIPHVFSPANSAGATAPASAAGQLVVTLADTLIGLVITQMTNPGACLIIGGTQSVMDMRSMIFAYGAPELSLLGAGITEMAEYLGLPAFSAGGCSDSKQVDIQSAIEASFSIHAATLSGANLVHDVGFLDSGMTGSLLQLVLADELIAMSRRISRGVLVNKQTLAVQEINEIAHKEENFSDLDHTLQLRHLHWVPDLMARRSEKDWRAEGSKTLQERLREKTRDIVKGHQGAIQRVPDRARQEIKHILAEAEKEESERSAFSMQPG